MGLAAGNERPVSAVPWALRGLLVVALLTQILWAQHRPPPVATIASLPAPPAAALLHVLALGEPAVLARALMLWLQGFDYQSGTSVAFRELDYVHLERWLARMLELDPQFQYPLLAAARVYAEVADPLRQRRMLDFVARQFRLDPQARWQWMAHAVYVARHRLHDQDLALAYARELAALPASPAIPNWVRQMHIFALEDLGELESARVLLGGLLDSGEIADPHERWFLSQRLHALEQRLAAPP